MNDRDRAISILRQAREILIRRLTERVLEVQDEILDDARGLTYCGEIDTIYEQVGVRLNHVSAMLTNLPAEEQGSGDRGQGSGVGGQGIKDSAEGIEVSTAVPCSLSTISSPVPSLVPHEATVFPAATTFELFARQVLCDDLDSAGRSLAVLFAVDAALGRRCAGEFHARLGQRPEVMTFLLQLRRSLQEGSISGPLGLLRECFGLEGLEALSILQTLRARLMGHNEAA